MRQIAGTSDMTEMTPNLDLRPDHWDIVRDILRRHIPDRKVLAFGSRATWSAKHYSDLDIAVLGDQPLPLDVASALAESFEESDLPFKVDVVDWASTSESFRKVIEKDYVVLVEQAEQSIEDERLFDLLPQGWEYTTLGIACARYGGNIQTGPFGSQLHASDYVPVGIPSIMPKNIGDNRINLDGIARIRPADASRLSRYLVREGDIVYSRRGDVERRALVRRPEDGWLCGTGCLRVRFGKNSIDSKYASYFLGHPDVREWITRHAHGATMANLNTSILSTCPFVIPPKKEQRAIAHILGTLDDKIELNRCMNETLEAMARALFKSWFVDFDPVRAKMEGRNTDLPNNIADLFPDRLVDSELGEIPEEWDNRPLTDFFEIIGGGTPKTSVAEYWGGDIPWFSVSDTPIKGSVFVIETEKNISEQGLVESSVKLIPAGTTIISARGTVGNLAMAATEMTFNQSCYALRRKGDTGEFFVYLVAQHMITQLQAMAHGSVFSTITRQTFEAVLLAMPSPSILKAFEEQMKPLFQRIQGNVFESLTLTRFRDMLLPKLISGEIRVPDAEAVANNMEV